MQIKTVHSAFNGDLNTGLVQLFPVFGCSVFGFLLYPNCPLIKPAVFMLIAAQFLLPLISRQYLALLRPGIGCPEFFKVQFQNAGNQLLQTAEHFHAALNV